MPQPTAERVNINLPKLLLDDLRRYVPRSQRSQVIARATARELRRIKLLAVFDELGRDPAWSAADHPDLASAAAIDQYFQARAASWTRGARGKKDSARG